MNKRASVVIAFGLAVLCEPSQPVLAQDAVSAVPAKSTPAAPVARGPAPAPAEETETDWTAAWARSRVKEAREISRCLAQAAAKVEIAARRFQSASDAKRSERADDLDVALGMLNGCEDPPVPRVAVKTVSILGDPCGGDPLCDADVVYEQKLVKLIDQRLVALRECYRRALFRHPRIEGNAAFEIELDKGDPVRVSAVKHSVDELGDPAARACIDHQLQNLAFTDREKGLRFRAKLAFERDPR